MMKFSISSTFKEFIQSQKFSGILLICCTVISLLIANSSWSNEYLEIWHSNLGFNLSDSQFTVEHLINDGLMAMFFLLVGLEIKREIVAGELSTFQKASIPVAAALGGMIIPALIYTIFNNGTNTSSGWGIPMATDIAFAIGVLSLLGNRVPDSLKVLLTALAVVDDLGAVIVIALFYSSGISLMYLSISGGIFILLLILNKYKVKSLYAYLLPGILLWYCMYCSGVHSTIAGVLLAMTIPYDSKNETSSLLYLEHRLHTPVNYFIMPLFALANTAIIIPSGLISQVFSHESLGIVFGLMFGKPIGIISFILISIILKLGKLPEGISMKQIIGLGFLGGIGFTMSIFISLLAFSDAEYVLNAKLAVLIASCLSGIIGFVVLKRFSYDKNSS